jgi:inositol oxygenase
MSAGPLNNIEEWDDDVKERYRPGKTQEEFRDYGDAVHPRVREFYRLNHTNQTYDFVQQKHKDWLPAHTKDLSIWEALEYLDTLVDDSDPDTDLSQIEHCLQTSESIRKDGHPRWMVLTGLIHDLGKILWLEGEPQWAVVGDTFPVGCAWSDKIVFHEFFQHNPDKDVPEYQTKLGVYEENCGLDKVYMSWGHDEYMYWLTKDYLPEPAQYMIRYHSFYPAHKEGAYDYLMNDHAREMFDWVRKFNPYDLYSKGNEKPNAKELKPYYDELIAEFFPKKLKF